MEVEKPAEEFSKEELRRQLYSSLRSTGVLDSMKGQLRARLLEHLRHQNGDSVEPIKRQGKPSLTERLLSSLFLDYLESNGFTFTISVFMPESQMASWPPFSYEEMLELLHLDPSSDLHIRLKLGGEGRECLAHQLVTMLQQMAQRNCIQEVSTQTSPAEACKQQAARTSCTSPKELEMLIRGVEDTYGRKKEAHEAQRLLPYRSLEDKITILHKEFDARVNAEVALQVSRLREYEIIAARMDEAARYRRQLARDREELEDIHKSRMDRIKAREESLLERMLSKEKAIEASAYEQRQKILTEITGLRERENKLRQFKDSQERREGKLDERELSLRAKEEEVVRLRKTLYAQADDITALRRKELEEHYKELCDRLHRDRTLVEAEREQMKEDKVAMAIELAASRSDKELIQALRRRQSMEDDQRLNLIKTIRELEKKLKQQSLPAPAPVNIPDHRLEERLLDLQAELEQERLQRQASEKENKTLERKLHQKKVELAAARNPQGERITEHKNLMATIHQQEAELQEKETKLQLMETEREKLSTKHRMLLLKIDHLDTLIKKAQEEKDRATCNLEILQVQHTTDERELLETIMLLRKAQQALEAERLEHCALLSHMNAVVPSISVSPQRDRPSQDQHGQNNNLFDHKSSADETFRKKWESFRKKPKRESPDLWTQISLSDNAAKRASLDRDLERYSVDNFPSSTISKPFSSGFGYQILELRDDGTAKGGITSVTRTESLIETVVNGSIEEYYRGSWDQERYGEHSYEDAIPSWRKTYLPEVVRPASWNIGYEELVTDVQCVVTNRQRDWSKVDMGVCSSSRDPGIAWNLGQYGDLSHRDRIRWDMAYFEGEEMGEKYDQKSLNGFQDFEMTARIRSASILGINSRTANTQNLNDPDTSLELKAFLRSENSEEKSLEARHIEASSTMKGATTTERIQRDTHTMEIKCQRRLASSFDDHEHENLDLNRGKPLLKEKDYATSNDEEDQSLTSVYGFTTSTNIQTSRDISSVEDNSFKKDSRSSWDPEKHKTNSRTSLEPTQDIVNGSLLTVGDVPVVSHTEDNDRVEKPGAESSWNLYLGESEENTRDNSEAEDSSSQNSPSCKCILSLKYGQESLEESAQSKDSHSKGDHHKTVDSAAEVPKKSSMTPDIDNMQPLNSAQSVDSKSCEYVKGKECIEADQHYSQSETESKTVEEDKTRQATPGDGARERDVTDEAHEPVKLTNRVIEVTIDFTSLAPNMKQSEGTVASKRSPTLSIGDSDIAQDPDKDLNQLMRSLAFTVATNEEPKKCFNKKEEEPLSKKAFNLLRVNSQKEESRKLVHENRASASGKMSGLPEIGEMLIKQEMHAREKAQKNLQDSTAETQLPPESAEVKGNRDVNMDSLQDSKLPDNDKHALETLRTFIVIRKQEVPIDKEIDKETGKESPRLMDSMGSHKNHPILALAIRNNQLVKLETQDELPKEGKTASFLSQAHAETIMNSNLTNDETRFSNETPCSVNESSNTQQASEHSRTPASHEETHSSSEESIYKGDSFEEEEEGDEVDQKPAHSEESWTNEDMSVSSEQAPGSLGLETNESSHSNKDDVEGNESRSLGRPSENWEGESEPDLYSPDEDDTVADSAEWLDTCGSQQTNAHGDHSAGHWYGGSI